MLFGPDVSSYQGYPDWQAVAAYGCAFGWTKITENTGYVNPTFVHNWLGMQANGLVRGVYHFAQPSRIGAGLVQDAIDEADFFLNTLWDKTSGTGLEEGDLVALDLEAGTGDLLEWTLTWLREVEDALGVKPMLYSGNYFLKDHNCINSIELAEYGVWIAAYQVGTPPVPAGWDVLAMWQHTSQAHIPGIDGPVDESYFFGERDQLLAYGLVKERDAGEPAPVLLTRDDQLVTIASVIGDQTYPDGVNMWSQAPGQAPGITRAYFQRLLVQHQKALLGAG